MIWKVQLMRGNFSSLARFLSSSCLFSCFLALSGCFLLPCSALAAEEFNSFQMTLMSLLPFDDLITSLADMPLSRQSQNNVSTMEAVRPRKDGWLAVAPGYWGVNPLTDWRMGWSPLETAPPPLCSHVTHRWHLPCLKGIGMGRRGRKYLSLAVGRYTAVCCPDEYT
jgi:hypothetical protein